MQLDFFLPSDSPELLDPLYNHKEICELLVRKGVSAAVARFRAQSRVLETLSPEHILELRCIFLNSLNRSLYNFILFTWNISLSVCCFQNKSLTHAYANRAVFEDAGEKIIKAYSRCLNDGSSNEVYVSRAMSYINDHLDSDLSLASVSGQIFISPCYLCKIFKAYTGMSIVAYITNQRVEQAKKLLLSTGQKVDDIAASCGFHSSAYFTSVFRKCSGVTPSVFREQGQKRLPCAV